MKPDAVTAQPPPPDEQCAVNERWVAELIGVSCTTLKRWRKKGIGPPWFGVGAGRGRNTVRYVPEEVYLWREKQTRRVPEESERGSALLPYP